MPSSRSYQPATDPDAVPSTRLLKMVWSHRLFLNWPVDPETVREYVPPLLELDTVGGRAWLGLTAFRLGSVRAILTPPMPGLSSFNEVNAHVCVTHRGERGVFFFSLDASSSVAVWTARTFLHLPYFRARIQFTRRGESLRFVSKRGHQGAQPAEFDCAWTIGKPLPPAQPGDLVHFLTERRQTFTMHRNRVYVSSVEHEPWPLREAKITRLNTTVWAAAGLSPPEGTPLAYHGDELAAEMCSMREASPVLAAGTLFDPAVAPPPASIAR